MRCKPADARKKNLKLLNRNSEKNQNCEINSQPSIYLFIYFIFSGQKQASICKLLKCKLFLYGKLLKRTFKKIFYN